MIPEWLELSPEVSLAARCVYGRLVQHWGQITKTRTRQECYASIDLLSVELTISRDKVKRAILELERHKLLLICRRPTRNNQYFFLIHEWQNRTPGRLGGVGVQALVRQRKDERYGAPAPEQRDLRLLVLHSHGAPAPVAMGTGAPYKETQLEETQVRDSLNTRGSLRSPQAVSLRSSVHTTQLTEDQIPPHESIFTHRRGFAANSVSSAALAEVVADCPQEDAVPSPEEMLRLKALMQRTATNTDHVEALKAKKRLEKQRHAHVAQVPGELPVIKPPKQTVFGVTIEMQNLWIREFKRKFPNEVIAVSWGPKEAAQLKTLLQSYPNPEDVERGIQYVIQYWDKHLKRNPKIKALLPTFGFLVSWRDTFMPEAKLMLTALKAQKDYDDWCAANPNATSAPDELQAAYDAARQSLKTFGS